MKNNIIIANWKMNLGFKESLDLINKFLKLYNSKERGRTEVVVCPSFMALNEVHKKLSKTQLALGAQDCFWEDKGAFTGEISPLFLKDLGCQFVIIGHSERRGHLRESDEMLNRKIKAALKSGLVPIVCVGEKFEERQSGEKEFILMKQLERALIGVELEKQQRLIVAYEPVWVIGSGQAVAPAEAEHTNQVLKQVLLDHYNFEVVNKQIHLIYGGSVDQNNIKTFLDQSAIEGFLIGSASLKPDQLWSMIKAIA